MTITLAQLEGEVGRRVGPYAETFTDRQIPSTATFTFAFFPELRSTIDLDSVTNLWTLRRGVCWDPATGMFDDYDDIPIADRQRLVAEYDPARGQVFVDRPWGAIPEPGEWVEFHHLVPSTELRRVVQAGLRRCFIQDQLQVAPTSPYGGIDLTAQCPWLTDGQQVQRVQYGWAYPVADAPFETVTSGGHVYLTGTTGPYAPVTLWLTAMRPAWSWVNGADSTTGPSNDWDQLDVDLDYAAAAAHIEAWHLFPSRLQAAAAGNLQATQEMAAREFTRQSLIHFPTRQGQVGFKDVVGLGAGKPSWVNL